MSRPLIRSQGSPQRQVRRAAIAGQPAPTVSPPTDLKGKRLSPANAASGKFDPLPRTLAGATILQIVSSLREEPHAYAAVDTARMLLNAGARAFIAGDGGPLVGELRAFGGEWIPMTSETANPLTLRRNTRTLTRMIVAERVDIIHALTPGAAWSALMARRQLPFRLVTSFGDKLDTPNWLMRKYASALAKGDRIIAPSSFIAHAMIERYRIPPYRITVIPRRIDTAAFSPAAVHPDRIAAMRRAWGVLPNFRIALVPGRLAPWNGQIGVVDAARLLVGNGRRNVVFVFAGDDRSEPDYRKAMFARAGKHNVETLVRFAGHCSDMPTALAASDVVVIPALTPPLTGHAAAQAQAMGRPVVVNAIGVLPENVLAPPRMAEPLRTGWVVRPGHAGELAKGIAAALSLDPKSYEAMGARARQFAAFMFAPENVAAGVRGLYTSLLSRG